MISRILISSLLWLLCGNLLLGQVLKGQILDQEGQPIPYANIGILDTQIGTASNEDGLFVLFFSGDHSESELQVSAISYRTFKVKLSDITVPTDYEIRLAPHYIVLDEIEVSALDENANKIVEKALEYRLDNYAQNKYQLQGFYRELLRNDETYVALTEAAFTMEDKGYHKGGDKKFRLDEVRKSNDMRDMDELDIHYDTMMAGNDLAGLFRGDFIDGQNSRWSFSFWPNFSENMLKNFDFILDSMTYYDGQLVYCLSFFSKSNSWFKSNALEYNRMVVTSKNYAVIEMHRGNKPKKVVESNGDRIGNVSHLIEGHTYSKSSVRYREYKGKWYPYIITLHSSIIGGDRQKSSRLAYERLRNEGGDKLDYSNIEFDGRILNPDKNNYYRYRQVLITSVSDHKDRFKKIRNKDIMERRKYVRSYDLSYNSKFWSDFNTIMRNPYLKAAKADLVKKGDLEDQFIKNGN